MNVQNRSPIRFRFDEAKATQVAMRLLEKSENRLSHLALMKMLYIIDREALARWERPVIGGRYCSMEFGTVISQVLTLMRAVEGIDEPNVWTMHLEKTGNQMRLIRSAHVAELSPAEIKLIDEVSGQFGHMEKDSTCDLTLSFDEWKNLGKSTRLIRVESILAAVGKSDDDIERIADEVEHLNRVDALIGA